MAAAATVEPGATATAPSLATEELIRAISATNRASGRRTCTTLLNQWKKEILPKISRSILFELLADADGFGGGGDAVAASDRFNPCDDKGPSILTALIMIINHHDDFSTEGHRESSVEILKLLCRRAFADDNENDAGKGTDTVQEKRLHMTLLKVFHRYLQLFQNRMTFHNASNNDGFHHGTMTEPREPSEHIRLLLVELMVDLGGYCLTSFSKDCFAIDTDDKWNKMIIEATSDICQTLSKSTFLDPYPEISRAACDLVQLLAQLCPLAVRMNAASLLVPLSGRVSNDTRGGVEQSSTASISKKCLMRHRHAKTRCKAVEASTGIVLCCPRLGKSMPIKDEISADMPSISVVGHLSNDGSHSTSMEHILQHSLLPEWEDLLKLDSSASVKLSVLQSLGSIANTLKWSYSPDPTITFQPPTVSASDLSNLQHTNTTTTDITTVVEARVLTLFLVGMSKGSVAGVRSLAIQQLRGLSCEGNGGMLSKNFLVSYFGPMLELLLSSCSNGWACCQSRVSSLDALQVLFSITIPLMNDGSSESSTCATQVRLSDTMIHDIVNILSMNILSDEKVVIEASFACCHTLGANDSVSNAVVALLCDLDDLRATVIDDDFEAMAIHSNESKVAPSPRHLTSQLLILDKLLKGSITSKEAASILREVDPTIYIPTPHWFHESLSSATAISKLFYHTAITNNVSSSSSLAWALADACDSFANCVHDIESKLSLTEDIIVNVLVAVAYLLGCPSEFDLSSKAMGTLRSFSSSEGLDSTCEEKGSSLFDVHFRKLFAMIVATAPPFPWKQSEPALLAVDALLRACSGSTVGSSFDMVAPFFISHLSTMDYNNNSTDGAQHPCSNGDKLNDEMPEDYSLRISLMAMLQTILTDKSFSNTLTNQQCGPSNDVSSSFSAQFTADVILSIVLPNLVWRVGGMASALRKLSLATLFSLLIGRTALIHPDILSCLIPTLHSSFDDADSSVRELSCVCLSLTIQQVSNEMFSITWENNPQAIDTILPRLLELLDDSHGPVRIAVCNCLRDLFPLVQSNISLSSHETITASLLIQLDDPDEDFQSQVFQALSKLVELQSQYKDSGVVEMMARQINSSMKSHRDTSLCRELLGKLEQMHNSQ
ncbi:hypothetical protein ACHAXH_007666 [Discostella pseudostelligera]